MVAPSLDGQRFLLELVAAWAAETVAEFLLRTVWGCAALLLQISNSRPTSALVQLKSKHKSAKSEVYSSPHAAISAWLQRTACVMCTPQQLQQLSPQQLLALTSSDKDHLIQSLVSTSKRQAPNCWIPRGAALHAGRQDAGPTTAPSETSTTRTGSSAAAGQSSSTASGSTSAQGSHHSSGQNSIGGGGQDDSDEDGDEKRRRTYQMLKSHSLETPDPLFPGSTTASLIQAAVERAQESEGTAAAKSEARAALAASITAAATSSSNPSSSQVAMQQEAAPALGQLSSPFAAAAAAAASPQQPAAAAAASSSSSSSQVARPTSRPRVSPFASHSSQEAAVEVINNTQPRSAPAASSTTSASSSSSRAPEAHVPTGRTAPKAAQSPFAAAQSPFAAVQSPFAAAQSVSSSAADHTAGGPQAPVPSASATTAAAPRAQRPAFSSPFAATQQHGSSPFAAAQRQGSRSPFGSSNSSHSSSGGSSGRSDSRQAAATAAAAYAASRASKGSSSTVGSRGPSAGAASHRKLHSPFAAAPLPAFSATSTQLDAVAEDEPFVEPSAATPAADAVSSRTHDQAQQLSPTQQSVDALAAAAAASAARFKQAHAAPASPSASAASSGHSSYSGRSSKPPTPRASAHTQAAAVGFSPMGGASAGSGARTPQHSCRAAQQVAGSMLAAGPVGHRSPFAAAAAVAAATEAAFTPGGSRRASPASSDFGSSPPTSAVQSGSRKGSAAGSSSRAQHVSSMAHSISLNTMLYPRAFGSSSMLGSSMLAVSAAEDAATAAAGSPSGTAARPSTVASSGSAVSAVPSRSPSSLASGSRKMSPAASGTSAIADRSSRAASAALAGIAPPSPQHSQQRQQRADAVARAGPSASSSLQRHAKQPHTRAQPLMHSPFAAAAEPALLAGSSRQTFGAAAAAPAGAQQFQQPLTFKPTVLPIAVTSAAAALMPPVLTALPPAQQQAAAYAPTAVVTAGLLQLPAGMQLVSLHPSLQAQANMAQQVPGVVVGVPAAAMQVSPQASAVAALHATQRQRPLSATPAQRAAVAAATGTRASSTGSAAAAAAQGMHADASAATSAAGSAGPGPQLSCMCVAPSCLAEGQAGQVQVYVMGLEGKKGQQGPGHTYRVAAFMGNNLVAEDHRECRGGERVLRVAVPALPKGVLQILVLDASSKPCFMQHVLVLPGPCAHDLNTLWSQLLRGQISTAGVDAALGPRTSSAGGSNPSPLGSNNSSTSSASGSRSRAMSDPTSSSNSSSNSSSSAAAAAAAAGGPRSNSSAATTAAAAAAAGQPRRLGPVEIQAFWQDSFSRVLTEVAAVLLTRSPGVPASSSATAAAAAGEMRPRSSFDTPVMKSRVSSFLHFFATNSKWAIVELLTSHMYGYGSSARAMYTSKVLDEAQAAAAAAAAAAAVLAADAAHTSAAAAEAPAGPTSPAALAARSSSPFAQVPPAGGEIEAEVSPNDPSGQQGSSRSATAAAAAACAPYTSASVRSEGDAAGSAGAVRAGKSPAQRGLLKLLRVKFKQAVGE